LFSIGLDPMSPIDDSKTIGLRYTNAFLKWRTSLRDAQALARIATRLERLEDGHWGDARSVGGGVTELRLQFGPDYRLYVARQGDRWVVLLCGGDKSSQKRDIVIAHRLVLELNDAD